MEKFQNLNINSNKSEKNKKDRYDSEVILENLINLG